MQKTLLAATLVILCAAQVGETEDSHRKIQCKTPAIAQSCYWTHGRLTFCCGTPAVRVWKIGTHRVLGVFSGPQTYSSSKGEIREGDNEDPALPENLKRAASRFKSQLGLDVFPAIIGDYEVCPLQLGKPKTMQAVCIESAKNLIAQ